MARELPPTALLERLRAGDPDAPRLIVERYLCRLIGLARSRLDARIQQKEGAEDVVQSVFKSFFLRQADGRLELHDNGDLWALLAQITVHKCGHRVARYHSLRRDVRREIGPPPLAASDPGWEPLVAGPTPADSVALTEILETVQAELRERDRAILTLSLQGASIRAISAEVGCAERTVHRVLHWIRKRLAHFLDEDFGAAS